MANYKAIFKCRLCCKEFYVTETTNKKVAENAAIHVTFGGRAEPLAPSLLDIHMCDNGGIGIADFLGFSVEEE